MGLKCDYMKKNNSTKKELTKLFNELGAKYENAVKQDRDFDQVKQIYLELQVVKKRLKEFNKIHKNYITYSHLLQALLLYLFIASLRDVKERNCRKAN